MKKYKYSDIPFNNGDAASYIIGECIYSEDPMVGFDLGDDMTAVFEIRLLSDDTYYLKESLEVGSDVTVDEDTNGEFDEDQLIEVIIRRLQILDDTTDYPRLTASMKRAISSAKQTI